MQCHAIVGAAVNALPSRATPEDANANPVSESSSAPPLPWNPRLVFRNSPSACGSAKWPHHFTATTLTPSAVPSAVLMPTFVEAVRSKYEYKKSEDNAAEAGSYGVVGGDEHEQCRH